MNKYKKIKMINILYKMIIYQVNKKIYKIIKKYLYFVIEIIKKIKYKL